MTLMFRAYDCKNNKWLHGYTPGQEGCHIDGEIVLMGGWLSEISLLDLNNICIEQFTGIYDKKSIPIFVGDYVKATFNNLPSTCEGCSNNPKNGGSGICHCILGMPDVR